MVSVSTPPISQSSGFVPAADEPDSPRMDELLAKLRRNMVELILQGDDVTRQMWQMYSVFEEIFGLQKQKTSKTLKPVVVGDKLKSAAPSEAVVSSNSSSSEAKRGNISTVVGSQSSEVDNIKSLEYISSAVTSVDAAATKCHTSPSAPVLSASCTESTPASNSTDSSNNSEVHQDVTTTKHSSSFTKSNQRSSSVPQEELIPAFSQDIPPVQVAVRRSYHGSLQNVPPAKTGSPSHSVQKTFNPLLDTIGSLAGSNPESDDSDLDIVYQQLRYRGRQRRPEQVRIRTQRPHHHHHQHHQQFASSDPESTGYAGSNSIDSGYKSLCATPEVSDSLSAPEAVRRSTSDISASDSSATSSRKPRSSEEVVTDEDPKSQVKIKMGTRSIASKISGLVSRRPNPLSESSMRDVNLDHLMYLRQSLRKDRQEYHPSSSRDSIPSSSASSTVREDVSPSGISDEDSVWSGSSRHIRARSQNASPSIRSEPASSPDPAFIGGAKKRSRILSGGGEDEIQETAARTSSDSYLRGIEYYDLDSVHDFPAHRSAYPPVLKEKGRNSRIDLLSASKYDKSHEDQRLSPLYRKKKHSQPLSMVEPGFSSYGISPKSARETSAKLASHRYHRNTDSKLTEAAIRVLEMIEDFRMEEAMEGVGLTAAGSSYDKISSGSRYRTNVSVTSMGPHAFVPRFRRTAANRTGVRPASTGSLVTHDIRGDPQLVQPSRSSYVPAAEHHVYEEIMYDLVCARSSSQDRVMPPMPPDRSIKHKNSRLLPLAPAESTSVVPGADLTRMMIRSRKQKSNMYSLVTEQDDRSNMDRFLEMEWHAAQGRRESFAPDFPV